MTNNPIIEAKKFSAEKPFEEALRTALSRAADDTPDLAKSSRLEVSADVVSMLAMRGVEWAVKIMRDTLDGIPTQRVEQKIDMTSQIEHTHLIQSIEKSLLTLRPSAPGVIENVAAPVKKISQIGSPQVAQVDDGKKLN